MLSKNDIWNIIDAYFKEKGLVRHQTESFDEFLTIKINKIIEDSPPIEVKYHINESDHILHVVKFKNTYITKPQVVERDNTITPLTPNDARLRNLTYESTVFVNVEYSQLKNGNNIISSKTELINLCNVPIMVGSSYCITHSLPKKGITDLGECEFDQGGYFIINGSEKALIAQERLATNNVYVFINKIGQYVAEIRSIQEGDTKSANQILIKYIKPSKKNGIVSDNIFRMCLPYVKKEIPLIIVFRALGISDNEIIKQFIDEDNRHLLEASFEESEIIRNKKMAIEYIGKRTTYNLDTPEKREEFVEKLFSKDILAHIDFKDDLLNKKAMFIGYMVNKLILTIKKRRELDDRDHWGNKRVDLSSNLLGSIFRSSFSKVVKDFKIAFEKNIISNKTINLTDINKNIITRDIKYALSTGNWSVNKQKITKTGVSQVLSRLSYLSTLSHLRRIVAPIAKDGKSAKPRQLHTSSFGIVCPAETPEGHACGIVKNMSLNCHISLSFSSEIVEDFINSLISQTNGDYRVFLNGKLMGYTDEEYEVYHTLKECKRTGKFNYDTSIIHNISSREICINTDGGRCSRPLIVVKNGKPLITRDDFNTPWNKLVEEGKIEYLDVNESEHALIAMDVNILNEKGDDEYTHCELHPSMIMSVCSGIIPYPDHNQAPRNCYQSSMSKQAMGIYATNFDTRLDTMSQVLFYPQKRLVEPKTSKYVNFPDVPAGENAIVAIMCHTG